MARLTGKTALITGAARGIGKAVAERFAEEGAALVITDLDGAEIGVLADQLAVGGADVLSMAQDVTDPEGWAQVTAKLRDRFGVLDILVNNAGIGLHTPILTTPLENWRKVLAVNLDAVFLGTQAGIRAMLDADGGRRAPASVVNISSVYGLVGRAESSAYSASKGGVRLFTKSVALEAAANGWNIRVNSVHPGFVETPMAELAARRHADAGGENSGMAALKALHPMGRLASPREIADAVLFLSSDESTFVTGTELVVDGAMSAT